MLRASAICLCTSVINCYLWHCFYINSLMYCDNSSTLFRLLKITTFIYTFTFIDVHSYFSI